MLIFLDILLASLFWLSFVQVRKEKKKCLFIHGLGFLIYAFVWEDLLVFSLFFLALINIAVFFHDIRIALLGGILFYCVRSAGETLYYFLQQFIEPEHHPHDIDYHFTPLRKIFGDISFQKACIILQVLHQVVLVISLTLLTLLLLNWNTIPTLVRI